MNELVNNILPAYPFIQYNDDENIIAFFNAYNKLAQEYLTTFNKLNLGFWPCEVIKRSLLDWIAMGIYGVNRHLIISLQYPDDFPNENEQAALKDEGIYNTIEYNEVAYNEFKNKAITTTQYMSDDFFKRILL